MWLPPPNPRLLFLPTASCGGSWLFPLNRFFWSVIERTDYLAFDMNLEVNSIRTGKEFEIYLFQRT